MRPRRSTMSPRIAGASRVSIVWRFASADSMARSITWRNTSRASMPATQSARQAATTATRLLSVTRQSKGTAAFMSPPRDDGLRGRLRGNDALEHDGFAPRRRDEVEASGRQRLDAPGRLQRFDLETQAPVELSFGRALPLQLFDHVAVAQQLEVLPRREQQHRDEERADARRLPHLALTVLVDLADDGVVADVLLDRVFEVFRHARAFPQRGASRCARADSRAPRPRMEPAASSSAR